MMCDDSSMQTALSKVAGVERDPSVNTINDLQRHFFLESSLVMGGQMTLHNNLHDAAPRKSFLADATANQMPTLSAGNAAALVKYFGLSPYSDSAKATATAAYLCGYGALPGEKMSCAASAFDLKEFVTAELGSRVKILSTSGTPGSASPAAKTPVTIAAFTKGSAAEGQKIVVCHVVSFPSLLFYCHRVTTGTKVITATLHSPGRPAIQAVGVCHIDTPLWLSTHPAFRTVFIPHGDELCHWLVDSDLLFVPAGAASAAAAAEVE